MNLLMKSKIATLILLSIANYAQAQTMADAANSKALQPKIEMPVGVEGPLNLDQIKALFTGRTFHGKITPPQRGTTTEENYEFFTDGSAKMWGQKTIFGGHVTEGKGTWIVRDWQGTPSICWNIKGTWFSYSCSGVKIEAGIVYLHNSNNVWGVSIK